MKYYLLDACPLVAYYAKEDEAIAARVGRLFAAHSQNEAFIFVPNFCVAEVITAFSRKCFEEKIYGTGPDALDAFQKQKQYLLDDVIGGKILYSYELSRRHILGADDIYSHAHGISFRGGSHLGAFDILILSIAKDLSKILGRNNVTLVTAEGSMYDVCRNHPTIYPRTINVRTHEII